MLCALSLAASAADRPALDEDPSDSRVARLQDALRHGGDWDIGMPELEPSGDFEAAVRDGRALESEIYRELDGELRRLTRRLAADPDDSTALAESAALRERLRERVESNLRLGYLYAAGVYVEMLDIAGAEPATVRDLTRRVQARRDFERAAERFDAALAESRIESPPGDNARFWLGRMRAAADADSERLAAAEQALEAELDDGGSRSP